MCLTFLALFLGVIILVLGIVILGLSFNKILYAFIQHREIIVPVDEVFPRHILLLNSWQDIRNEALCAMDYAPEASQFSKFFFGRIGSSKWKTFVLRWYGTDYPDNMNKCPVTTSVLNQLPEIKSAMFSILEPYSRIPSHFGVYRGALRYHLGLVIPSDYENVFICVKKSDQEPVIKYHWREGQDVLFDDTYEHWVENNSDEPRIILFCDVERNDITSPLINFINHSIIHSPIPKLLSRLNDKNEKTISTINVPK
jgi:beta-hydroxylase